MKNNKYLLYTNEWWSFVSSSRPQLEQLFVACIKIFVDKEKVDSWRHLALEIIVTLAETAPAMVRKVAGNHLATAIQVSFKKLYFPASQED